MLYSGTSGGSAGCDAGCVVVEEERPDARSGLDEVRAVERTIDAKAPGPERTPSEADEAAQRVAAA